MSRRLLALLLAAAMLVPAGAFGAVLHVCRVMGRVDAKVCCCHRTADEIEEPAELHADCCEVKHAERDGAPLAVERAADQHALVSARAALQISAEQPSRQTEAFFSTRARGPPPRARLFLQNCSLLI